MKEFSLRQNYSTIELVGPLKHLRISIDYGRVQHDAVYSEADWLMRFLNKRWDFTLDSVKAPVLPPEKQSDSLPKPLRSPAPVLVPDPPFSTDVLDPDTYEKLLKRLMVDHRAARVRCGFER